MDNDKDWLEDVRRWYFNGSRPTNRVAPSLPRAAEADSSTLGYEAAHPALQASAWQTPTHSGFGALL